MTTAPPGNAAPPRAVLRWLPWWFTAALVLPFDPFWIDFEQARRGLLACGVGAALLLSPRLGLGPGTAPARGLRLALVWLLLVTALLGHAATELPWLAYGGSLLLLPSLGAAIPRERMLAPVAWTLIACSGFGLLQRLGRAEFFGYGAVGEPVSVFGNLNVAAEWTTVALAALLALQPSARPRLAGSALLLGTAYLVVTGARSALLALPCALGWWLVSTRPARPQALRLGGLLLGGGALGALILGLGPQPFAAVARPAQRLVAERSLATIDVRWEIARGCAALIAEAPLLGHGYGRFAAEYPRHRSQREIELSSFDRQFETSPTSAHDDWLQLAVEGGVPALLLWVIGAWQLLRAAWRDRDGARTAPFVALLALMLVRAPLGNAPCAALALLFATSRPGGAPRGDGTARQRWLLRGIGALLAFVGAQVVRVQAAVAPYLSARYWEVVLPVPDDDRNDPAVLTAARNRFAPDARVEHLLAQEHLNQLRLLEASEAIQRALALRPFEPSYLRLQAELQMQSEQWDAAQATLRRVAALDPGDPQLLLQLAALRFCRGDADGATQLLYTDPHWRLEPQLATTFDQFAARCPETKDPAAHRRYLAEAALRRAFDACDDRSEAGRDRAQQRFQAARSACAAAGMPRDPRLLALIALLALESDASAEADRAAELLRGQPLAPWQCAALGRARPAADDADPRLAPWRAERLRRLDSWRPLLPQP